jgi:hypothetical protein
MNVEASTCLKIDRRIVTPLSLASLSSPTHVPTTRKAASGKGMAKKMSLARA